MTHHYSKKIFLISENGRIATPIRHALNRSGLDLESDYTGLHSLSVIRMGLARTGKTAFIRTELMRFINAFIIDGEIDLGTMARQESDKTKLLKTLVISYIILSRGKEFENLQCNLLVISKGDSFEQRHVNDGDAHSLLKNMRTGSDIINSFIDEMAADRRLFNSRFFVNFLDSGKSTDEITMMTDTFLRSIDRRIKGQTGNDAPVLLTEDSDAAKVIFRIDADTLYDDGAIVPPGETEYSGLNDNEFYIIGTWSHKTQREDSEKIARALLKGLGDRKRFTQDEAIVVNLDERCRIDGTTALSLAQLFIKNLSIFKKVTIRLSAANGDLFRKSQGYSMIKTIVKIAR
jgi:hypothetical protein